MIVSTSSKRPGPADHPRGGVCNAEQTVPLRKAARQALPRAAQAIRRTRQPTNEITPAGDLKRRRQAVVPHARRTRTSVRRRQEATGQPTTGPDHRPRQVGAYDTIAAETVDNNRPSQNTYWPHADGRPQQTVRDRRRTDGNQSSRRNCRSMGAHWKHQASTAAWWAIRR